MQGNQLDSRLILISIRSVLSVLTISYLFLTNTTERKRKNLWVSIDAKRVTLLAMIITLASLNAADGSFNITGHGVDGEGTFTLSNNTAEIGLHMVVGQMADKSKVWITMDKRPTVSSLRTTSDSDHTEMDLTFTREGKFKAYPKT